MRTLLFSAVSFFVASTVAVAAPASKPAASASFAAHQTVTEKQATGLYDLSGLPKFTGKVAQFLPAPHGGVLGVVLTDGTQVLVSPDQGHTVAGLIKPGDTVSIQGLKARSLPLIRAFSLTSPRGRSMQDSFIVMPQQSPEMITGPDLVLHGDIWMPLYDLSGQVSGVILKDHTVIYLPRVRQRDWLHGLKPGKAYMPLGQAPVVS